MKKQILSLLFFSSLFSAAQNPLVKMWDKRYGGTRHDWLTCIQQTRDGGFIIGGHSHSNAGGDKSQDNWDTTGNTYDYWIVRLDSSGSKLWDRRYGGMKTDYIYTLDQTNDGGFILGGSSSSGIGGDKSEDAWDSTGLNMDYWIVKIDSLGNKLWDKTYGGLSQDDLYALQQTADGGYILGGASYSGVGGNKNVPNWDSTESTFDYWIIKTDIFGSIEWEKDLGGAQYDGLRSLTQCSDAGYLLGGYSNSQVSGDKSQDTWGGSGDYDYWILKTDSLGDKLWEKDFGGTYGDILRSLQQTTDNGFILGGSSFSNISGDKSEDTWGAADNWMVKIDSLGNKQWDKDLGGPLYENEFGNIIQCADKGFLMAGYSNSNIGGDKTQNNLGTGQSWIVKTDSLGNKQWDITLQTLGHDQIGFAIETNDGCFAFANYTEGGIGGDKTENCQGDYDYWIVKFCDSTLTTSTALLEKDPSGISIFPNPTLGQFTVDSQQFPINQIEIYNSLGEKIYSSAVHYESCIVNCASFSPGIYFVKATSGEKIFFEKFIKN